MSIGGRWLLLVVATIFSLQLMAQAPRRGVTEHVVKQGETVYSIAQRYGTTPDEVYKINPWARDRIKDGDKILIVAGSKTPPNPLEHTISAGETLYRVARNYGISESELIQANPGLSADHFVIGRRLRIPPTTLSSLSDEPSSDSPTDPTVQSSRVRLVRVLLVMPFVKVPRYLEFYQGFLMGMNDLKKDGVSIHLTVLDAADDDHVHNHIQNGALRQPYDLVIGGVTERQIDMLAEATRSGFYVVPFSSSSAARGAHVIRLNQAPSELIPRVIPRFIQRYRQSDIYLAYRGGDTEDAFVQRLKPALTEAGISYRMLQLDRSDVQVSENALIIPVSPDKALAERVVALARSRQASVFGYPQWQSYGAAFVRALGEVRATIYSSFYFDVESSAGKQFLTKYNAWYSKKLLNGFPRYGVLGYDIARFFIRAHALLGNEFVQSSYLLSADGLQLDIHLEQSATTEAYINRSFYFITFSPDGSISRLSM